MKHGPFVLQISPLKSLSRLRFWILCFLALAEVRGTTSALTFIRLILLEEEANCTEQLRSMGDGFQTAGARTASLTLFKPNHLSPLTLSLYPSHPHTGDLTRPFLLLTLLQLSPVCRQWPHHPQKDMQDLC